jgi:DNA end-binding protein Ku
MIEIAEKIIEQAEGPFEPEEFRDRYEDALRDLIERKQKGEDTTVALPAPETSNVIDLMDALKKSLAHKGAAPHSKPAKKAAAKGSKAKKRTRKSA